MEKGNDRNGHRFRRVALYLRYSSMREMKESAGSIARGSRFVEKVEGYRVAGIATDAQQAKELLEVLDIDLVLLDTRDQFYLPTGIDRLTLDKVSAVVSNAGEGLTAEQVARVIGASRSTARRYLEYLVSEGILRADLYYGAVGRPERVYFPKTRN